MGLAFERHVEEAPNELIRATEVEAPSPTSPPALLAGLHEQLGELEEVVPLGLSLLDPVEDGHELRQLRDPVVLDSNAPEVAS